MIQDTSCIWAGQHVRAAMMRHCYRGDYLWLGKHRYKEILYSRLSSMLSKDSMASKGSNMAHDMAGTCFY